MAVNLHLQATEDRIWTYTDCHINVIRFSEALRASSISMTPSSAVHTIFSDSALETETTMCQNTAGMPNQQDT